MLTELGIKVPEDVSFIGFDHIFESQVMTPELMTIHVKKESLALLAVEKLIADIHCEKPNKSKLFIGTEIVVRNSCKGLNLKKIHR